MARLFLAFIIITFTTSSANAFAIMNCCPIKQDQISVSETTPCHESDQKSPQNSEESAQKEKMGCMCIYSCTPQLHHTYLGEKKATIHYSFVPELWMNELFLSRDITPESPPPKA